MAPWGEPPPFTGAFNGLFTEKALTDRLNSLKIKSFKQRKSYVPRGGV
jgi:hypothetical protein